VTSSARFRRSEGVHARRFDDEIVLLDLQGGRYYGLDEVGADVWEALSDGATVEDVVARLHDRYDVERARLEQDVRALVDDLMRSGLLVAEGA
jgi:hypothetical protein